MARTRSTLNVVSAALALFIMAFLVWDASSAAFTATTDETVSVSAVDIDLTDDNAAIAAFNNLVLNPGDSVDSCVTVTYVGTASAPLTAVQVDATLNTASNTFSDALTVTVGEVASCGDTPASPLELLDSGSTLSGLWQPSSSSTVQAYAVTLAMADISDDTAMGQSAGFTVQWSTSTP
ncbi:MAG: hypothetical protein HKN46_05150 [Acidimicrobiia bacterium]|nr:hypothetical protein [Acidimicrobiia bacterium]